VGLEEYMGEMRNAYKVVVVGKIPFRTPRCTWEDNNRMDLRETGWEGVSVDWIHRTQDSEQWQAVVNMVMNLWVP
jgi:hypothetical protein